MKRKLKKEKREAKLQFKVRDQVKYKVALKEEEIQKSHEQKYPIQEFATPPPDLSGFVIQPSKKDLNNIMRHDQSKKSSVFYLPDITSPRNQQMLNQSSSRPSIDNSFINSSIGGGTAEKPKIISE